MQQRFFDFTIFCTSISFSLQTKFWNAFSTTLFLPLQSGYVSNSFFLCLTGCSSLCHEQWLAFCSVSLFFHDLWTILCTVTFDAFFIVFGWISCRYLFCAFLRVPVVVRGLTSSSFCLFVMVPIERCIGRLLIHSVFVFSYMSWQNRVVPTSHRSIFCFMKNNWLLSLFCFSLFHVEAA